VERYFIPCTYTINVSTPYIINMGQLLALFYVIKIFIYIKEIRKEGKKERRKERTRAMNNRTKADDE